MSIIRAELRSLDSIDAPGIEFAEYQPDNPFYFGVQVTVGIGPKDDQGIE